MFASLLRIVAAARLGAGVKHTIERAVRRAAVTAVAVALLAAGATFALIAAYLGLRLYFSAIESAGIMAAILAVPGLILLMFRSGLSAPPPERPATAAMATSPAAAASVVKEGARDLTSTLGPVNVILLALMIGVAAGRSLTKS